MIYSVTVKPGSKKGPLVLMGDQPNELVVYLREKPIDGSANQALIKTLAEFLQVPKTCLRIKVGSRGRQKLIEVVQVATKAKLIEPLAKAENFSILILN